MTRRHVLALLGGTAVVWPFAIQAQQTANLRRIFWVSTDSQPDPFLDGFREGLRERGYVEGKDVILELRYAPGNPDALRTIISELTRGNADLAVSSGPAIRAMRAATDVPVLFAISGDPVADWSRQKPGAAGRQFYGRHVPFARPRGKTS